MRGILSSFSYTSPSKNGNKHREKLDNWFPIFLQFPLCYITKLLLLLSRYMALKEQYAIVPVILASVFCFFATIFTSKIVFKVFIGV